MIVACEGPVGPTGPTGSNGSAGADGAAGAAGAAGADGQNFNDFLQNFETDMVPFTTSGDAVWFRVSANHYGPAGGIQYLEKSMLMKSGTITHSQESNLQIVFDMPHSGIFTFEVSIDSEQNIDWMSWFLDGVQINGISGSGGPFILYFEVPAGPNTVNFKYIKDASTSVGFDAAKIDNVLITNYETSGRMALPPVPELPNTVSLWSDR